MHEDLVRTINGFIATKPAVIDIIGYGSAVKTQSNADPKDIKQIDIIATVSDAKKWHHANIKTSRSDYNPIAKGLVKPLLHVGTDIEYLSNIPYDDKFFKIGVIERFDFLYDLHNWSNFYMAGRCQKPIMLVKKDNEIEKAIRRNRLNALRAALILNYDKKITEEELYKTICELSYMGDIRMFFGMENPNKVRNIVTGEFGEFKKIYSEVNEDLYTEEDGIITPNTEKLLSDVPDMPSKLIEYIVNNEINIEDMRKEDLEKLRTFIVKYLRQINLRSSIAQPVKSVAINNFGSSYTYAKAKRKKYTSNKGKSA